MKENNLIHCDNKQYNEEYCNDERKEIDREYDYGVVIFEGEYLNGERNGKGKEYYYGNLRFEGEYKNGGINGIGKEYNTDGKII